MTLSNNKRIILMFLIIICANIYGFDHKSISDFIIACFCSFTIFYLAYKIGLDKIRENAIKNNLTKESLEKKENNWKKLFVIIVIDAAALILVVIINW